MRVLLDKKSRKKLFFYLKENYSAKNFVELAKNMKIPYKTLKKWMYAENYMPNKIIPIGLNLKVIDKKPDNWGAIKGGKLGGRKSVLLFKKKLGKAGYSEMMRAKGKRVINTIWKRYDKTELINKIVTSKIKRRELQSKILENKYKSFFINNRIIIDNSKIHFSKNDLRKNIIIPKQVDEKLAEEIGIHLGDGCLLKKKNYFSVKCDIKEEENYVKNFLLPLYKKLYNIDLKLIKRYNVCGFEIYSKVISEFKNKVIRLPYGKKIHKIEVPKLILNTRDRRVYSALIRGLFDTDGCIYISRSKYPVISITIKSEKLIQQVFNMLKKMGFIPTKTEFTVMLNGPTMLIKWIKEIGSNNPKNIARLEKASSITWIEYEVADLRIGVQIPARL